jgi:hypothetical protein
MRAGRIGLWAVVVLLTGAATAEAGNWSVLTRHFHEGPTYGCHPHLGWQSCMMPWQPIQSSMHYNVLPPGMHRPWPLIRPTPSLAPPTPDFSAAGVWAAGQRNKGIPCQNPYALPPAGCDYYSQRPWWGQGPLWDHLAWWKKHRKSPCDCPRCSAQQSAPEPAPEPTVAPVEVPVAVYGEPDPYDGQVRYGSTTVPGPAVVAPAPLPPSVELQPWIR